VQHRAAAEAVERLSAAVRTTAPTPPATSPTSPTSPAPGNPCSSPLAAASCCCSSCRCCTPASLLPKHTPTNAATTAATNPTATVGSRFWFVALALLWWGNLQPWHALEVHLAQGSGLNGRGPG
jgi:hypothetical protein